MGRLKLQDEVKCLVCIYYLAFLYITFVLRSNSLLDYVHQQDDKERDAHKVEAPPKHKPLLHTCNLITEKASAYRDT